MKITTPTLTRLSALSAIAAGLLFIAIQINHPPLSAEFALTSEYAFRQSLKVLMAVLSLIGITGMYLRQVKESGVLGLLGYMVFGAGYLTMISVEAVGAAVIPAIAQTSPGYVNDLFALATGGQASGDIGLMQVLILGNALTFLGGGLLFGIALLRAKVLSRWAAALLASGAVATLAIPLLPQVNARIFALPIAIALIGLGYSLLRSRPSRESALLPEPSGTPPELQV